MAHKVSFRAKGKRISFTAGKRRGSAKKKAIGKRMFKRNGLSKWAAKVKHGQVRRDRKGRIKSFTR
jgi:hypothetical protein